MTTRRDFIRTSAGVGAGAALGALPAPLKGAPAVVLKRVTPTCVASANGLQAVARAIEELAGGASKIEAVVRGVNLVEEDPTDTSVGYGGLPNDRGVVQLDSSLMHGPTRGAGAVAALEGIKRPSLVALDVMRYTDHHLLAGQGAQDVAVSMGHRIEDLLTDATRQRWIQWRARLSDSDDYLTPAESAERIGRFPEPEEYGDGLLDSHDGYRPQGTINCDSVNYYAVNKNGDYGGAAIYAGARFAVSVDGNSRHEDSAYLFERA